MDAAEVPEGFVEVRSVPKIGRPALYTPELARKVLKAIEDGDTIRDINATEGLPNWDTIRNWLREVPDFSTQYARAYELSAFSLENEALDAVRDATDSESATVARAKLDGIKWATGKRNPKVYGDKVQHDVSGEIVHLTAEERRLKIAQLQRKLGGPVVVEGVVEET